MLLFKKLEKKTSRTFGKTGTIGKTKSIGKPETIGTQKN